MDQPPETTPRDAALGGRLAASAPLAVTMVRTVDPQDVSQNCDSHAGNRRDSVRSMQIEAVELPVERRTADPKRPRPRAPTFPSVPGQHPLQSPALRLGEDFGDNSSPRQADRPRGSAFRRLFCVIPNANRADQGRADHKVVRIDRDQSAPKPLSVIGASRMRAFGNAILKFSASMRRAASTTATEIRLAKASVRSARQEDTSRAATRSPS